MGDRQELNVARARIVALEAEVAQLRAVLRRVNALVVVELLRLQEEEEKAKGGCDADEN